MEATSNCGGEGRRKARREAGLALLFVAHGRGCSVCVLGAHFIVMRQFIIYVEPTNGERWISCRPRFFLHVRVLSRLFPNLASSIHAGCPVATDPAEAPWWTQLASSGNWP